MSPETIDALARESLLPEGVTAELLRRWQEPHRRYHGISHLVDGLAALDLLGAGELEKVAYWFHDAVHTNTSPADELASAELARGLLAPHFTPGEIDEVCRLILATISQRPDEGDERGARVVDADLHGLGSTWDQYLTNVAGIRAELPGVSDEAWCQRRISFAERLLGRGSIFATQRGRELWERQARINLRQELDRTCQYPPQGRTVVPHG